MGNWTSKALQQFAAADDLHVSPYREDGKTYGTPTWVWGVVVENVLYARAYHGQRSSWYQAAIRQKGGKISMGGISAEVVFEAVSSDDPIQEAIDKAYQAKYSGSPYLPSMIRAQARAATVSILPKDL
ncbi:MAG: DUF2255 family protein [Thermoflavifilum sp.]|nr:DUF2255 family protein [Thermoflavifilum sp.]